MSDYFIAYRGGRKPESPEEGAKLMGGWKAWIGGLGDAVVNPGTPLGKSSFVSSDGVIDGGGAEPLSGYTIIRADSIDAAVEMIKDCPHLDIGGTLEVAEIIAAQFIICSFPPMPHTQKCRSVHQKKS